MPGFELIGEEEKRALLEIFDDGGIFFAHGFDNLRNGRYRVREFERKFAGYLGAKYAVAVSSGTAALKIGLLASGVKSGDEVITQPFTFVATIEAIMDIGAKPILVDIDDTLNIDPKKIEEKISDRTKVILPVDMLGVPADYDQIIVLARKHNLKILADSCESLGAEYEGEKLGLQADAACWSLDFGKTITTGEGGIINTDNPEIFKFCKEYHDHGHENNPQLPRGRDSRSIFGFNYRMTELQAAVGMVQLDKLDYIIDKNRRNYKILYDGIDKHPEVKFRDTPLGSKPLDDTLIFSLPTAKQAEEMASFMEENGIYSKNIPSAMEWHFAGYWDHIFGKFNISKDELKEMTTYTGDILKRSIAIGIMVKDDKEQIVDLMKIINEGLKKVL